MRLQKAAEACVYGAMFGIVATMIIVATLGQVPSGDMVLVPADRVALPAKKQELCDCASGGVCKCDVCECEKPEPPTEDKPEPQPAKVLSVDPVTGYQATKATVVMISRDWCGPCQTFKRGPMPGQLVAQGWDFQVNTTAAAAVFPTYRVFDGKRWHTVKGVLTGVRLRMLLNPKYQPVPVRERVQASGVQWLMEGQPWTRQNLIDHLAEHANHGHDRRYLESLSMAKLQSLHNRDHEAESSRSRFFGRVANN